MGDEIDNPINSIAPSEKPDFRETLKNTPNLVCEKQLAEVFTNAKNNQNKENPILTHVDIYRIAYNNNTVDSINDPLHIDDNLPLIKWLKGVGNKLQTVPECFEAYELDPEEYAAYVKRREQDEKKLIKFIEDVEEERKDIASTYEGQKIIVSREIWKDLAKVNKAIKSSHVPNFDKKERRIVATEFWIRKKLLDSHLDEKEVNRILGNAMPYLDLTNQHTKEDGAFYYAVNLNVIPEKDDEDGNSIESII
jgi:hypothetical protein